MGSGSSTNKHDVEICKENASKDKENRQDDNKTKLEIAKIKAQEHKLECETKKEMQMAAVKLEEMKIGCDHEEAMGKIDNEKLKATIFVEAQANVIGRIMDKGVDSDDFCISAGMAYLTLKQDHSPEEADYMKRILDHTLDRKNLNKKSGKGHFQEFKADMEDEEGYETHEMVLKQG